MQELASSASRHCTMTLVNRNGVEYYTIKQTYETTEQFLERSEAEAYAYFDTL